MSIFLMKHGRWCLFDFFSKECRDELDIQGVKIGKHVTIESDVKLSHLTIIGDSVRIETCARIAAYAVIGHHAVVGDYAKIGYTCRIGDYAEIGDGSIIGDYAKIGKNVKIDKRSRIFDYAEIGQLDVFSVENIYLRLGVLPDEQGNYILYESVRDDLTSFTDGYRFKIGGGDSANMQRNQHLEYGEGWSWSSLSHAIAKACGKKHKVISATINIGDILSVHEAVRVCKFRNVQEVNLSWNYNGAA